METDQLLDDLMVKWGQARAGGHALAPEDLCLECPELTEKLRERLTILEAMSWLDEVNKHQPGDDTLPHPAALLSHHCAEHEIPDLAMPPETLRQMLVDAGVLTVEECRNALRDAGMDEPLTCQKLAEALLRQGKLTPYQLCRVVEGRGGELVMGSYLLLDEIGAGGMGRVYRAHHRRMKRVVALKVLSTELVHETALQRFHREVEAVARLDHPNIVIAHDAAEAGGRHFLVMQYVDGEDLARLVARRGPLSPGQALNCLQQAALGLEYAHKKGIIHRDVKPGNLMIDRTGVVKLLDLGLARLTKSAPSTSNGATRAGADVSSDLTEEQVVMGTADYMAPEQAVDTHRADQRSDIYGLGCTLHFLLTGRPPYTGATLMARVIAHHDQPIPSLRKRNPEVPEHLEAIFQKMVAKDPAARYPSVTALLHELAAHAGSSEKLQLDAESVTFLTPGALVDTSSIACRDTLCEEKPSSPPPRPRARRFRPVAVATVALGVVAVVVGLLASGVFRVQTPEGVIEVELEGKPIPMRVNEDGTITITDPSDGKKIEVKVEKDQKLLTLTKEGFQALALEFNLSTKDGRRLTARFVPNPRIAAAPDDAQILFVSQRTGNLDIFLMNLDGTGVKNLTEHSAVDAYPAWSPDGQTIAFASDRGGVAHIYLMDADGKNLKQLTTGPKACTSPAWSPDGKTLLFAKKIGGVEQIVALNLEDGKSRQLTGPKKGDGGWDPSWSPDGKKIVFGSVRSGNGWRLYIMDADGENVQEITRSNNQAGFVFPAWSPDGKKIAYGQDVRDGAGLEVFVRDGDGKNPKQLTWLGAVNTEPAWSPDGKHIIFQHRALSPNEYKPAPVYIMDADGGNQRVLLANEGPGRAAWRPSPKVVAAKSAENQK